MTARQTALAWTVASCAVSVAGALVLMLAGRVITTTQDHAARLTAVEHRVDSLERHIREERSRWWGPARSP